MEFLRQFFKSLCALIVSIFLIGLFAAALVFPVCIMVRTGEEAWLLLYFIHIIVVALLDAYDHMP